MNNANGLNTCNCLTLTCSLSGWALSEYVVFSVAIWWISYLFLLVLSRQSEEWTCRVLTLVHGSVVSYSAIRDIINNRSHMVFQDTPLTDDQKGILSFMLSYFLFDAVWIQLFGHDHWVMKVHHISSILVIVKVMMSDFGGLGVSFGVAGLEVTNPFLQTRWFLRTHGYQNKPLHTAVELIFCLLFFAIRLVGGSVYYYYVVCHPNVDITLKLLATTIYLVSLALAYDIYRSIIKRKYLSNGRRVRFVPAGIWRTNAVQDRRQPSDTPPENETQPEESED